MARPSTVPDSHWMALLNVADKAAVKGTAVFTRAVMTARNQGLTPQVQANLVRAIQSGNAQAVVDSLPWEDYWQSQFDGFQAIFQDVIAQAATAALPNINQVRESTWRKDQLQKRRRRFAKKGAKKELVQVFGSQAMAQNALADMKAGEEDPNVSYVLEEKKNDKDEPFWGLYKVTSEPKETGKPKTAGTFNRIRYKFDRTNPDAVAWAKVHAGELITQPADKAAIKKLVVQALEQGVDSKTYAKQVLQYIGMGSQQVASLNKWMKDQTKKLKPGQTIDPAKHQKKVDQLLRKRSQFIALNEALVAAKQGNEIAVQASLKSGDLQEGRYLKEWVLTPDDKLCPICAAQRDADGDLLTVPVGEPWPLKAKGTTIGMIPHAHPRCRCAQALVENPAWIPIAGPEITGLIGGMPAWIPPPPPTFGESGPVPDQIQPIDLTAYGDLTNPADAVAFVKALNKALKGFVDNVEVVKGQYDLDPVYDPTSKTLKITVAPGSTNYLYNLKHDGVAALTHYQTRMALQKLVTAIVRSKLPFQGGIDYLNDKVRLQMVNLEVAKAMSGVFGKLPQAALDAIHTYIKPIQLEGMDAILGPNVNIVGQFWAAKTPDDFQKLVESTNQMFIEDFLNGAAKTGLLTPLEALKVKWFIMNEPGGAKNYLSWFSMYSQSAETLIRLFGDVNIKLSEGDSWPKGSQDSKTLLKLLKWGFGAATTKIKPPQDVLATLPKPPKVKGPPKPKKPELGVGDAVVLAGLKVSAAKMPNDQGQYLGVPHNSKGKVVVQGKGKKAFIPVIDKTTGLIVKQVPVQGGSIDLGNGVALHVVKDPSWAKTKGYYVVPSQGVHWDFGPNTGKVTGLGSPIKLVWNQHGQLVFKGTPLDVELPTTFSPKVKGTTGTPLSYPKPAVPVPAPAPAAPAVKPKKVIYSEHADDLSAITSAGKAMEDGDYVHSVQQNPQTGKYEVVTHLDADISGWYKQKQTALDKAEMKAAASGKKYTVFYDPYNNAWAVVDVHDVTSYHPNGTPIVDEYHPTPLGSGTPVTHSTVTAVPKPAPAPAPAPAKPVTPTSTSDFAAVDAAWAKTAANPAAVFKFEREARDLGGAHTKYLYRDAQGNQWLFKPVKEAFRATGEELAYKVSRLVDPKSVEVRVVTLDGRLGTIQPMLKDVTVGGYKKLSLANLDAAEYRAIMAEHVVDWLIGNHDGHADNFLRTKDGTVYGIDKGQVYKFIGQDKLDGIYNPNAGFETPIYNQLRDLVKQGKLDPSKLDLTDAIAAVRRAAAISDADLMALARPYVEGRTQNPNERTRIMNAIVARKQGIIQDFERYWTDLLGRKVTVGTSTPAPAATAKPPKAQAKPSPDAIIPAWTTEHDAIIADVERTGWQGKAIDFDGGLVENHAALVWQERGPNGKPRTVIDMKVRADVKMSNGKTFGQTLDAEIRRVAPQGASQAPARAMKGDRVQEDLANGVYDKLVAAYKTTKTHATDLAFNQATLDALNAVVADLRATLVQVAGTFQPPPGKDLDYYNMVVYYNEASQWIASRIADLKAGKVPTPFPAALVGPDGRLKPYVREHDEPLAPQPVKPVGPVIKSAVMDEHFVHRKLDTDGKLSVVSERASVAQLTSRWNQTVSDDRSWKLDLGDGVTAIWYGQGSGVHHFTRQGQFTLIVEGEATPARVQMALKKLEGLGMDKQSVRMSSPEDREVAYLIRHGATNKLNDQVWNSLMARSKAGESATTLLPELRDYWSKRMKVPDVTKLPNYDPDGNYEPAIVDRRIGGGNIIHKRFDLDATTEMRGYRLYLSLTGGMNVETLFQSMLEHQTLGMLSTAERIRIGLFAGKGGMSPESDMKTGGGNYVFTRITRGTSQAVTFKNTLFERLDRRSYNGDSFGATDPNDSRSRLTLPTPAEWQRAASASDNETLFLNVASILDHIDVIHAGTASARQRIIGMMRSRGIDQFPDGRKLEQVIQE